MEEYQTDPVSTKPKLQLSAWNKIIIGCVMGINALLAILVHGMNALAVGVLLGSFVTTILIPFLITWLVWYVSKRNVQGTAVTFNVLMCLMFLVGLTQFGKMARMNSGSDRIKELQTSIAEFKENMLNDPESYDSAYADLKEELHNSLDDIAANGSGVKQLVAAAMKGYVVVADSVNRSWETAYNTLVYSSVLDFSSEVDEEDFTSWKAMAEDYIEKSELMKTFFLNRKEDVQYHLGDLDKNSDAYRGVMFGIQQKTAAQKPIFIPLMDAHIASGETVIEIIELVEREAGKWTYKNEDLIFENSESQLAYLKLLDVITYYDGEINRLAKEWVQVL